MNSVSFTLFTASEASNRSFLRNEASWERNDQNRDRYGAVRVCVCSGQGVCMERSSAGWTRWQGPLVVTRGSDPRHDQNRDRWSGQAMGGRRAGDRSLALAVLNCGGIRTARYGAVRFRRPGMIEFQ